MNYLRKNGFKVLTLTDLGYNDKENYFYINRLVLLRKLINKDSIYSVNAVLYGSQNRRKKS